MTRNLLTDVAGLRVGNAEDEASISGTTVLLCDEPAVAACDIMGAAPGTRDIALLEPENTVDKIDAIFLSGGSAFGLDAGGGVQAALRESGRGFEVLGHRVPIVPGAIIFDLANGGDKNWGRVPPYWELAYRATLNVSLDFEMGSLGAGTGALVSGLKGGLGSASARLSSGKTVGAIVVANATGSPVINETGHFWAAAFEKDNEFGGLGWPARIPEGADAIELKKRDPANPVANTTLAVVATDAALSKAECKRLAVSAHDGFARALWPVHTAVDGDLAFSVATGHAGAVNSLAERIELCAIASAVTARAIARAIYEADALPGTPFPSWYDRFGEK